MSDQVPALTQIERIETTLLDLVRRALDATFYVELFPEDAGRFDDAQIGRAALLQYRGSDYTPREGLGAGAQDRLTGWALHLLYNATAATGSRPVKDVELLRQELQGRQLEGGFVELRRDGLAEQDGPRRRYILELAVEVPVVAIPRAPLTPLMTSFEKDTA